MTISISEPPPRWSTPDIRRYVHQATAGHARDERRIHREVTEIHKRMGNDAVSFTVGDLNGSAPGLRQGYSSSQAGASYTNVADQRLEDFCNALTRASPASEMVTETTHGSPYTYHSTMGHAAELD